ncbi:MAG: hypothetical protein ACH350_00095 [Parachlamydiaceae bacterium]
MSDPITNNPPPLPMPGQAGKIALPPIGVVPAEEAVAPIIGDGKGSRDVLEESSLKGSKAEVLYEADSPQAPLPSRKGRERLALRNDLTSAAIKSEQMKRLVKQEAESSFEEEGVSSSMKGRSVEEQNSNMWLRFPSSMGALYAALQAYRENLINSRTAESENRIQVRQNIYDAGMDAAETQKEATLKQALKEEYDAWNKMASGVMNIYQAKSQLSATGQAEIAAKTEMAPQIQAQETLIADLKADPTVANAPADLKAANAQKILEAEAKLNQLKFSQSQRASDLSREKTSLIDLQFRSIGSFVDAGFSMIRSQITTEEAQLQKAKAMLDALVQALSKTEDTVSRAKEESASEMQKIDQLIAELSKSRVTLRG